MNSFQCNTHPNYLLFSGRGWQTNATNKKKVEKLYPRSSSLEATLLLFATHLDAHTIHSVTSTPVSHPPLPVIPIFFTNIFPLHIILYYVL